MKDELSLVVRGERRYNTLPIVSAEDLREGELKKSLSGSYSRPDVENNVAVYSNPSNVTLEVPDKPKFKDYRSLRKKVSDYFKSMIPKKKEMVEEEIEMYNKRAHMKMRADWAEKFLENIGIKLRKMGEAYKSISDFYEYSRRNLEIVEETIERSGGEISELCELPKRIEEEKNNITFKKSLEECVENSELSENLISEIKIPSEEEIYSEISYLEREAEFAKPFSDYFRENVRRAEKSLDVINKKIPEYRKIEIAIKMCAERWRGLSEPQMAIMDFDSEMEKTYDALGELVNLTDETDIDFHLQMGNEFSKLNGISQPSDYEKVIEEINELGETSVAEKVNRIRKNKLLEE